MTNETMPTNNTKLTEMSKTGNKITEGTRALGEALKVNSTLTTLGLWGAHQVKANHCIDI